MIQDRFHIGLDIGSTTAKVVVIDQNNNIVFKKYKRHFSDIQGTVITIFQELVSAVDAESFSICVTGSSGLALSELMCLPFTQEVIACTEAVETFEPSTDIAIELGGEDAKIIYFTGGIEQRMNSACAGGTGAFIDQIATLLQTDAAGMNELALSGSHIYPIASRCGVFAKSDVQPLLNEGANKTDIALSIYQSVVNQVITGLAAGKAIVGNIAFLGGPLTFSQALRDRFQITLELDDEAMILPEDSEYFIALGASLVARNEEELNVKKFMDELQALDFSKAAQDTTTLPILFETDEDYKIFTERHTQNKIETFPLESYSGNAFLGIDAGSTTTKIVLIGENHEILHQYYGSNNGNPLESVKNGLEDLYKILPEDVTIAHSGITGYGEGLIREGLKIDIGQIETVAHYRAAAEFAPDVDFILDIGGQDMKCLKIKNNALDNIFLNEACSAGCGSFLESFASTLNLSIEEFVDEAIQADMPVDLGSRCTVFMNSKVKQVQKEGCTIPNLAAGLSYSVIKNALQKVIKLRDTEDLGEHIVVQGGTFLNDAVLRAFELLIGKEVIRPNIAGLMGAYGMALLAQETYEQGTVSNLLLIEKLQKLTATTSKSVCQKCNNSCALTITQFEDDRAFVTGNRCERGASVGEKVREKNDLPNLFEYKLRRTFRYRSLTTKKATRGTIGIPRALNIFENYPLWHTFLTTLGYRVIPSDTSSKELADKGMSTISSEAICYPAKLTNGHIINLLEKNVDAIFYPSVVYENPEFPEATNNFNCPVVAGYPEVIRVNVDAVKLSNTPLISPFLTLDNEDALIKQLTLTFPDIPKDEVAYAVKIGLKEQQQYHQDIQKEGKNALRYIRLHGLKAVVLAGHPYHIDDEVHHGIPQLITMQGMAVLTEDSIAHLATDKDLENLRIVNQWKYHARLYRAAAFTARQKDVEFVQLTSFGCGLDAITTDMCQEIIEGANKIYTQLKIDEISNLGAARIRIRSLRAAIEERERNNVLPQEPVPAKERPLFTKEMKGDYTILSPQLAPTHFEIIEPIAREYGYNIEVLTSVSPRAVDEGLKYVNNDACYPAILTIGQLVEAVKYGDYDTDKLAVLMSQTGGGCRATNYIALLKKALKEAGYEHIPVISVNANGFEKHPGFKLSPQFLSRIVVALLVSDALDRMTYRVRPYEIEVGSTNQLKAEWTEKAIAFINKFSYRKYAGFLREMVYAFDTLPIHDIQKPRVGVVGEILVKFHPGANNDLIDIIEREGGEAVVPDFTDFILYCCYDDHFKENVYHKDKMATFTKQSIVIPIIYRYRKPLDKALSASQRFTAPAKIEHIAKSASQLLSLGNQMGEGWFLTGEMLELLNEGVPNIACLQPFACLPNHITGRGMVKGIKELHPEANIMAVDYDAGISAVNQLNRIKLLLAIAHKAN